MTIEEAILDVGKRVAARADDEGLGEVVQDDDGHILILNFSHVVARLGKFGEQMVVSVGNSGMSFSLPINPGSLIAESDLRQAVDFIMNCAKTTPRI